MRATETGLPRPEDFERVSVIGCGRWGGFLGWYFAKYRARRVLYYGLESDPGYRALRDRGVNGYVPLAPNAGLTTDLDEALENRFVVVSVGAQNFRDVCRDLARRDLAGKGFLLAMKGLEEASGKRLTQVFREEIRQPDVSAAVLLGPGHVQDYLRGVPSCVVVDSDDPEFTRRVADAMHSELIRAYYGDDLPGNEIGAALKNVVGLAAGILDGLDWHGLKGALMARAPVEVGRFIEARGGKARTAYGLTHLGDYEATLFSPFSHNRQYGECLVKGPRFTKLAEGVATLKAVHRWRGDVEMPICETLYGTVHDGLDPKEQINKLFQRPAKNEF